VLPTLPAGITETGVWSLLQVLAKATLVLALAALVVRPLRRAAARHLVWSLALGALLVLPALAWALPAWRLPWLRVTTALPAGVPVDLPAPVAPIATGMPQLSAALLAVWLVGALVVIGRMFAGWWGVRRLGQSARPVLDDRALGELGTLCVAADVRAPVRLLRSEKATMPATWGVLRPAILLPADADRWSVERRRVVLLHELAHVARRDWLTQTLATLCCAAYWFHPGAWWAARRMRIEREEACDDRVLAAGARPSDYAGHLLEVARSFRRTAEMQSAALAMARPSQLEARVRAVLDARRDRRGVAYGAGLVLAGGVGLALFPLAIATPTEQLLAPRPAIRVVLPVAAPTPVRMEAAAPRVARQADVHSPPAASAEPVRVAPTAAAPAAPVAPPAALAADPGEVMAMDPSVLRSRSLAELIRATASPRANVRRDAVRALAQIRDEAVVSPLARSLRDQDPGVRTMAARALGELAMVRPRHGPSEPQDGAGMDVEVPSQAAAYALANRAAEALRVSAADNDPEIRDTALRALEEVGDSIESGGESAASPAQTQMLP
jgi:beta-lactamase regulating signal transducer with metallopeptidase domain